MKIGSLELKGNLLAAPMAGYSDLAYRLLRRELGASLCFSEMISCHGLVYQQPNTLEMLATITAERPVAFQLFGADPTLMGAAAALLSEQPIDLIDINMGCPVRKVIKKGAGAALLKDLTLARQVIEQVVANTHLPVSVKFRRGWGEGEEVAEAFAQMAEIAGASVLTLHGRTRAQGFGGVADWEVVGRVKNCVNIPVVGNGDIQDRAQALARQAETGCDGIMIGRAALVNPWVFQPQGCPNTLSGRRPIIQHYLLLCQRHLATRRMFYRIRNQVCRYLAGLPGAVTWRAEVCQCSDIPGLSAVIKRAERD